MVLQCVAFAAQMLARFARNQRARSGAGFAQLIRLDVNPQKKGFLRRKAAVCRFSIPPGACARECCRM
jgi:hypothetical protein